MAATMSRIVRGVGGLRRRMCSWGVMSSVTVRPRLELGDLVDAPLMPSALVLAAHEGLHAGPGELGTHDPSAHRQDVGVIMFTAEACCHRVRRDDAADARDLVGHDALAGAAPAEHDAALAVAGRDRPGGRGDDVGVVDRLGRVGAEVDGLVAHGAQPVDDRSLEREPGVIGGHGDAHRAVPPQPARRSTTPARRSTLSAARASAARMREATKISQASSTSSVTRRSLRSARPMLSAPATVFPQPVEEPVPVVGAEEDDGEVLDLAGLDERHGLEQLVERAEAAREDDEALGVLDEHRLAHEEVAEGDVEVEVGVAGLLVRQLDGAADRVAAGFLAAAVGRFHDARAAAGDDREAGRREPGAEPAGIRVGGVVLAPERADPKTVTAGPRRASASKPSTNSPMMRRARQASVSRKDVSA